MNEQLLSIILTVITASTPLLLAAMGELVVERSGVLNLGVEGMMAVGAVCGLRRRAADGLARCWASSRPWWRGQSSRCSSVSSPSP